LYKGNLKVLAFKSHKRLVPLENKKQATIKKGRERERPERSIKSKRTLQLQE
jgi:hypothetical protein